MNPTLNVKPAPGLLVRDPDSRQPLPPEGAAVASSTFWHRRLADGDVLLLEDPARAGRNPTKTATKEQAK